MWLSPQLFFHRPHPPPPPPPKYLVPVWLGLMLNILWWWCHWSLLIDWWLINYMYSYYQSGTDCIYYYRQIFLCNILYLTLSSDSKSHFLQWNPFFLELPSDWFRRWPPLSRRFLSSGLYGGPPTLGWRQWWITCGKNTRESVAKIKKDNRST